MMTLKVKKTLKYFEFMCQFDNEKYESSIYLDYKDMENFRDRFLSAAVDGYYTVRKNQYDLMFFREEKFLGRITLDPQHLARVLLDDNLRYELTVNVNPDSFLRSRKDRKVREMNVCQIINHPNIVDKKQITHIFYNAMRIGHYKKLKELVMRHIDDSHIHPESYREDELNLYFDGRFHGGCGYNGGILFHGKRDGFGSGSAPTFAVTLTPTSGYSIHT